MRYARGPCCISTIIHRHLNVIRRQGTTSHGYSSVYSPFGGQAESDLVFKQYDIVKVVRITKEPNECHRDPFNRRDPQVGDTAAIIEIYAQPRLGYELECVDASGETEWLRSFSAQDIQLELIARNASGT